MTDHAIYILNIITAMALLAYVILWSGLQTFNANPTKRFMQIWLKLALYYAAYTMPVWALLMFVSLQNIMPMLGHLSWMVLAIAVVFMSLYFYTVIVQPNRLRLHHQAIELDLQSPLTIAVLANLRIGLYSGKPRHIRKLVATINALSADAVLITGDWLYYPGADLVGQLMLFKALNKPVYTVMSISDLRYQSINTTKQGQPLLEDTLASAFEILDITYIGQQCCVLPSKPSFMHTTKSSTTRTQATIELTDSMNKTDNLQPLAMLCGWQDMPKQLITSTLLISSDKVTLSHEIADAELPVIILASRFDSITDLPNSLQPRPLLITGAAKTVLPEDLTAQQHQSASTGNIRNPPALTSIHANKRGLYQHASAQVFISSSIGTRGLPFRLSRPTIDVLTIR